jgi:hypothetical protein
MLVPVASGKFGSKAKTNLCFENWMGNVKLNEKK